MRFKCEQCGHEFTSEPGEGLMGPDEMMSLDPMRPMRLDCPNCGATQSCLMMSKCPKCEEYYVSDRMKNPEIVRQEGLREICPHCGVDVFEYRRQKRKNR